MQTCAFLGQPNCLKLSNGAAEAVVTTDIGPRIIRYALAGGENVLAELPGAKVETELGDWKPWGGHRLWHAPEAIPRSYVPDNSPIDYEADGELAVRLVQPTEAYTGIQKEMRAELDAASTRLTVTHRLTNRGPWPVDLAPWALTIMNGEGGGTVILPQEPYRSHDDYLLPARAMTLWHYTDLSDIRWVFGRKYVLLGVDADHAEPQKIGLANKQRWAAYARRGSLFVKTFPYDETAAYPDGGCNCETYTAGPFVEVETLGPMQRLEPGETAEHVEQWHLFKDVQIGGTEESIEAAIKPLIRQILAERNTSP